jgi:hypothetical protein
VMPVSSFTQIRRQPNQKLLQDTHWHDDTTTLPSLWEVSYK